MAVSAYLENAIADHVFGAGTYSKPTVYLALFVSGVEVTGNNYARVAVGTMTVTLGVASLAADKDFLVATPAGWGTIDSAALYDAPTGGNALTPITALSASKTIAAGDIMRAPAGSITFTMV